MASDEKKQLNVCWVTGNFYQRRQIINKVKAFLASKGEYETTVINGEETFEYVYSVIVQRSCIEETQRLVIINEWPEFKTTRETMYNHFLKMCQLAGSDIVIICNNLQTESKKFLKGMNEISRFYEYDTEVKQWEASGWIHGELSKREKSISDADCQAIAQAVGTKENGYTVDIDKMYCMVDKLCGYVGRRQNITLEDVTAVCTDSSDFIVWSLYNHLDKKQYIESMALIQKGLALAKTTEEFVYATLFSMIWRYRMLFFCKEGSAQGWEMDHIVREISKLHKMKKSGNGYGIQYSLETTEKESAPKSIYSQKVIEKAFEGRNGKPPVLCYSRRELYEILQVVEQTLHRVRAGCTEAESSILLDGIVMLICGVINSDSLSKMRSVCYGKFC